MAIDLQNDELIALKDACAHRLFRAKGKGGKIGFSTIWRWHIRGIRGVKLEAVRVDDTLMTSESAIISFITRLSNPGMDAVASDTPNARKQHEAAENQLRAARI